MHRFPVYLPEDQKREMNIQLPAFIADVISDNAKLDEVFAITFLALLILVVFTSFSRISSLITDLLFTSSSINEMNILILLLKDLHLRDYD